MVQAEVTMSNASWLRPHLDAVLRKRRSVLSSWRRQLPTQQGRAKNFETWIVVELVHHLLDTGFAEEIRTNGHFATKVRAREVAGLTGRKAEAKHLSADLSVRVPSGQRLSAEIKTGLAPKEVLNDVRIVRHYNEKGVADRAEFGWIVLLPAGDEMWRSAMKTFEKTWAALAKECEDDFLLTRTDVTPWLIASVALPRKRR